MEETTALKQESQRPDYLPWKDHKHLIGGEWVDSTTDERITIFNPATEEAIGTIPVGSSEDVNRAVMAAQKAHELGHWRRMPVADRARIVRRVGEIMMHPVIGVEGRDCTAQQ